MANKNSNILIGIFLFAIIIFLVLGNNLGVFSSTGGVVTRTVPDNSNLDDSFNVVYSASGTGAWAVSIVDSVTGGCTFPDGKTEYAEVILSDGGPTRTIKITTPEDGSECTFSGDYKFGTLDIVDFAEDTVTLGTSLVEGMVCCSTSGDGINLTYEFTDDCVDILGDGISNDIVADSLCELEDDTESQLSSFAQKSLLSLGLIDEDTPAKSVKLYVFLFYLSIVAILYFIINLISRTPK